MEKNDWRVAVTPCAEYSETTVRAALKTVLEPLGGLSFIKAGMTVVIKANLVSAMKPEQAATTHPTVIAELTKMLKELGADVILGDSPGGLYTAPYVNHVYAVSGMKAVEATGAQLNQDFGQAKADFPEAAVAKTFQYTSYLDKADVIINVCKLKSHGMMGMSAAAKNMFGVIPGILKPEYHYRFPNEIDFARMIVDLDEYFKPQLCLVDAVIGMEGNGPTAGDPRQIGCLVAGCSPHAVDLVCADIIGLTPDRVPTLGAALERNLIPKSVTELDIFGDYQPMKPQHFKTSAVRKSTLFSGNEKLFGKTASKILGKLLSSRPQLKPATCVGCGVCAGLCPAKAIVMKKDKSGAKKPEINKNQCIHCFCCQEFCPKGAMRVHRTMIAKLVSKTK